MFIQLTSCLVFLAVVLTCQGSVASGNHDDSGLLRRPEQTNSHVSGQTSPGKRSKRDSLSPGYTGPSLMGAEDDGVSLQTGVYQPEILSHPARAAVLQTMYNLAGTDEDGEGGDEDDDNNEDIDDSDDGAMDRDDDSTGLLMFPYSPYGNQDFAVDDDKEGEDSKEVDDKRARLFVGKRARLFVGKRPRLFVGKRPRLFVGKRQREFIGKRPRLFVGKRQREFIGKRSRLFVGKRQREFIGKRPRLFVGKRQRLFVGKRDWQANVQRRLQDFLAQRDNMQRLRELVGKRKFFTDDFKDYQPDKRPQRMFVGKRDGVSQMLEETRDAADKRTRLFVGERDQLSSDYREEQKRLREFVGKRQQEFVSDGDSVEHSQVLGDDPLGNKRSSRMFVGKRGDSNAYGLMSKRSRYFVGKRAGLNESEDNKDVNADDNSSSIEDESLQELKRSREFVGRR